MSRHSAKTRADDERDLRILAALDRGIGVRALGRAFRVPERHIKALRAAALAAAQ